MADAARGSPQLRRTSSPSLGPASSFTWLREKTRVVGAHQCRREGVHSGRLVTGHLEPTSPLEQREKAGGQVSVSAKHGRCIPGNILEHRGLGSGGRRRTATWILLTVLKAQEKMVPSPRSATARNSQSPPSPEPARPHTGRTREALRSSDSQALATGDPVPCTQCLLCSDEKQRDSAF